MKKKSVSIIIKILLLVMLLVWGRIIIGFSGQPGVQSVGLSHRITDKLIEIFCPGKREAVFDTLHLLVRKLAHMSEYGIFAALVSLNLLQYRFFYKAEGAIAQAASDIEENAEPQEKTGLFKLRFFLTAELICVLFAAADEFRQTFVEGRDGKALDVIIDNAGAIIGIMLVWIGLSLYTSKKRKKRKSVK